MIYNLTSENFNKYINESKKPFIVEFWATWCGFCLKQNPILEKFAERHKEKINFARVNIEESQELAQKYGAFSIPSFIIFKNGKEIEHIRGFQDENKLEMIARSLN